MTIQYLHHVNNMSIYIVTCTDFAIQLKEDITKNEKWYQHGPPGIIHYRPEKCQQTSHFSKTIPLRLIALGCGNKQIIWGRSLVSDTYLLHMPNLAHHFVYQKFYI